MASPVPQKDDVERWTVEQVSAWLQQMELTDCCESFLRRGIDGRSLTELTEEGLVLWGRDVSIRNRKKIMKLVRQIENQHLISTGRQQPSQIHSHGRHLPLSPMNSHSSSNLGLEVANGGSYEHDDEDDGFDTDEFEDYPDQDADYMRNDESPAEYRGGSPDSSGVDDGYMVPIQLPTSQKPPAPSRSSILPPPPPPRQPIPPERRGPMPLPTENPGPVLPQKQKMPFMPTQPELSRRSKPLTVISEPPRRPPPTPNPSPQAVKHPVPFRPPIVMPSGMAPLKPHQRGEWSNKISETSSNLNGSQPESSFEGGIKVRPNLRSPRKDFPQNDGIDNEYEIVETPPGPMRGNECHTARPARSTASPNPEPPPLPRRNPDGQGSLQHSLANAGGPHQIRPLPTSPPPHRPKPSSNEVQPPSVPQSRKPNLPTPPPERAPSVPQPKPPTSLPSNNQAMALPLAAESVSIGDGESIELTDLYRKLLERPYFHMISRDKSNRLLRSATDGVFLIRPSTRSRDPLTLSLQYNGRTYNINIRRRNDGYFALGTEKVNEITFQSVDDLVSSYTKDSIKLQSGARIRLTKSPEKVDHIYVKLPLSTRMK